MVGRPSVYSEVIADEICVRLASGQSLIEICADDHLPARSTVYLWIAHDEGGFSDKYARAREAQQLFFADEIIEIADDGTNDWIDRQNKDGSTYRDLDREHISRSNLRIESRKWLMARLARRVFGDKTAVEHSGSIGVGKPEDLTDEQIAARMAELQARRAKDV